MDPNHLATYYSKRLRSLVDEFSETDVVPLIDHMLTEDEGTQRGD